MPRPNNSETWLLDAVPLLPWPALSRDPTGEWGHQGGPSLAGKSCWAGGRLLHGSGLSQGPRRTRAFRDQRKAERSMSPTRVSQGPPPGGPFRSRRPLLWPFCGLLNQLSGRSPASLDRRRAQDPGDKGSSYCTHPRALWVTGWGVLGSKYCLPTPIMAVSHTRVPTPEAATPQSEQGCHMLLVRMGSCPSNPEGHARQQDAETCQSPSTLAAAEWQCLLTADRRGGCQPECHLGLDSVWGSLRGWGRQGQVDSPALANRGHSNSATASLPARPPPRKESAKASSSTPHSSAPPQTNFCFCT